MGPVNRAVAHPNLNGGRCARPVGVTTPRQQQHCETRTSSYLTATLKAKKGRGRRASRRANQNLIFQTPNNRTTRLHGYTTPHHHHPPCLPFPASIYTAAGLAPCHHGSKPPEQNKPAAIAGAMAAMATSGLVKLLCSSALLLLCCFLLPGALAEERFYEFVVSCR